MSFSLKVKLKLPTPSSPGSVRVSSNNKNHKKRRREERKHGIKKSKKRHSSNDYEAPSFKIEEFGTQNVFVSEPLPPKVPPKPSYSDMQRVIDHLQKQDRQSLFKDPVTDDVAPGYSSVISHPMDFTTLRKKFTEKAYESWDALLDDMMLIFDNSMRYNPPDTVYYKQSKTLKEVAKKLVDLGRRGVTNFRGKTAGVVRAHNAQVAADERAEKNAIKAAIRAQRLQMKNDKLLQKAAANGILFPPSASAPTLRNSNNWGVAAAALNADGRRPLLPEEHTRTTYRPSLNMKSPAAPWGGLISFRNGDGMSFMGSPWQVASRRTILPPAIYKHSLERFVKDLPEHLREHALRKYNLQT